ncbi:hypothetical protein FLL45_09695 [Aliikangiella marina]|uniref:Uncharacterized protein n=1 Tax=Aliikangiella marina TaxID=1712262 RepID=A0A545TDA7_9GAMM|nr:hypothetical protein [Aliikangiella marina]TQV75202.1 hypothetical protein FLL45_09695 [Aliikangiella marina]
MRSFKPWLWLLTSSTIITSGNIFAQAVNQEPDEAFLEFLASMEDVDGEVTDPLDMLDIADEPELTKSDIKTDKKNTQQEDLENGKSEMKKDLNLQKKATEDR